MNKVERLKNFKLNPQEKSAYIFNLPLLIILLILAFIPLVISFYLSLQSTDKFVGIKNYIHLFNDFRFLRALKNTTYFTIIAVFLELFFGLFIALLAHKSFKGRGLIRLSFLLPWALPTVVSAVIWRIMYHHRYGVFNYILIWCGIIEKPILWTSSKNYAMLSIIISEVWKTTPFVALILLAGLQSIPEELYAAARVDGASPLQQFFRITLPLLKPSILVAVLFRTMQSIRIYDLPVVLTEGGPAGSTDFLQMFIHRHYFLYTDFAYGSAGAIITIIYIMFFSLLYLRIIGLQIKERGI